MSKTIQIHIRSYITEYFDKATGAVVGHGIAVQVGDEPPQMYGPFAVSREEIKAKADELVAEVRRRLAEAGLPTRRTGLA